ncbi:hypothetical protein Xmar_05220 [Xanthomonas axonopodis pv. martyniicola]|nr:hypothetical protein Xmar_05220 [Xanthomonas axonopodis pv. martyniicola]
MQAFDAFYQFFTGVLAITSGPSTAQRRLSCIWIVGDVVDKRFGTVNHGLPGGLYDISAGQVDS